MANHNKYREYFDIDEKYFPCIDAAAIDAGAPWETTYPHNAFVTMITETERALARQNSGRTLWIEGAYGTGKSQCVYALRKILEVPEDELRDYWNRYEPLKKKVDLCEKLLGHKQKGIVVAHRYASGGIMSARDLFFAIQESVKSAIDRQGIAYRGENTLKESIIAWLEDDDHKLMFNSLLQNPAKEWKALFSQSTADEVLNILRKKNEVKSLVDNIFRLADKEGITALTIDSDKLIAWLTDIIDRNNIKIVFIWDEFSDYFKNNRESLSEFQKIAALVQNKPFYFIVVTHEPQQIYVADSDRGNQSKVSDRFISIPITLPDNIAFNLIGHAFDAKSVAQSDWNLPAGGLNERVKTPRAKVMEAAKIAGKLFGEKYRLLCLYHSRHYAKEAGAEPSKLCWADKTSILFDPWFLYLPRAWLSGELFEYREISHGVLIPTSFPHIAWYKAMRKHMLKLGREQRGDAGSYMKTLSKTDVK